MASASERQVDFYRFTCSHYRSFVFCFWGDDKIQSNLRCELEECLQSGRCKLLHASRMRTLYRSDVGTHFGLYESTVQQSIECFFAILENCLEDIWRNDAFAGPPSSFISHCIFRFSSIVLPCLIFLTFIVFSHNLFVSMSVTPVNWRLQLLLMLLSNMLGALCFRSTCSFCRT